MSLTHTASACLRICCSFRTTRRKGRAGHAVICAVFFVPHLFVRVLYRPSRPVRTPAGMFRIRVRRGHKPILSLGWLDGWSGKRNQLHGICSILGHLAILQTPAILLARGAGIISSGTAAIKQASEAGTTQQVCEASLFPFTRPLISTLTSPNGKVRKMGPLLRMYGVMMDAYEI